MTCVEKTHVDQASVWQVLQGTRCLDLSGAFMICQEHRGQTLVMRALVRSHLATPRIGPLFKGINMKESSGND